MELVLLLGLVFSWSVSSFPLLELLLKSPLHQRQAGDAGFFCTNVVNSSSTSHTEPSSPPSGGGFLCTNAFVGFSSSETKSSSPLGGAGFSHTNNHC